MQKGYVNTEQEEKAVWPPRTETMWDDAHPKCQQTLEAGKVKEEFSTGHLELSW
jgi:hypothetical protein